MTLYSVVFIYNPYYGLFMFFMEIYLINNVIYCDITMVLGSCLRLKLRYLFSIQIQFY